jgi:hypothetical protein
MGKPSAPKTPDYAGAAQATAAGNLEATKYATEANRVNTYTPYGSLTYAQDPKNSNKWTSTTTLAPDQQKLLDQQNKTSENLAAMQDAATTRVGTTLGQNIPSAYDPNQATNNAAQLLDARLLPQQQRDMAQLQTQLANQGITQGSEAYNNEMDRLGRQQNDARQQNQLQGINLGMTQQGQQYNQATANRNVPLNELNALRTGAQVTNPTFQQAPQQQTTAGPDMLGAANSQNQYNMGLYNSQVGSANGLMGGLTSLAGAGIMKYSDRRLKKNIRKVGTFNGLNVYSYRYKAGGPMQIGVMAQEVMEVNPSAVHIMPDGFMAVNYGAL